MICDFLFFAHPSTVRMDGVVLDTSASIYDVICCVTLVLRVLCFLVESGKTAGGFVVLSGSELHLV